MQAYIRLKDRNQFSGSRSKKKCTECLSKETHKELVFINSTFNPVPTGDIEHVPFSLPTLGLDTRDQINLQHTELKFQSISFHHADLTISWLQDSLKNLDRRQ